MDIVATSTKSPLTKRLKSCPSVEIYENSNCYRLFDSTNKREIVPIKRYIPSVNPIDGSLLTAPLSIVLNATAESLYADLHEMTSSEITIFDPVCLKTQKHDKSSGSQISVSIIPTAPRIAKMSNLSFAQRRHELQWRLIEHTRAVSHCAALVAAYLPKSSRSLLGNKSLNSRRTCNKNQEKTTLTLRIYKKVVDNTSDFPQEEELSSNALLSNTTLQHVHNSWVEADEAQDALYFHHMKLWNLRKPAHDIFGAINMLCQGSWYDISRDIQLQIDPYEFSKESKYSEKECLERIRNAVIGKLILGEVGHLKRKMKNNNISPGTKLQNFPWNMTLECQGSVLHLTYGSSRIMSMEQSSSQQQRGSNRTFTYPLEARVTVLSEQPSIFTYDKLKEGVASWTLLSISVNVHPKVGQRNHQLTMNRKQKMDFHSVCSSTMKLEEERVSIQSEKYVVRQDRRVIENEDKVGNIMDQNMAHPLQSLFSVSHIFSLSIHMEMLSAQADALRKETWNLGIFPSSSGFTTLSPTNQNKNDLQNLVVCPVRFLGDLNTSQFRDLCITNSINNKSYYQPIAVMAIHFWRIDDQFGYPQMSSLISKNTISPIQSLLNPEEIRRGKNQLTLEIRAIVGYGIDIYISGGNGMRSKSDVQTENSQLKKILSSLQNPLELSMADALIAATTLCTQRRCHAIVQAFQRSSSLLPPWLHLSVDCGSITISIKLSYFGEQDGIESPMVRIFSLSCDLRTGRYIPTFPSSFSLLRQLSLNDARASKIQTIQHAYGSNNQDPLTGRIVKDAFDALMRSVDILAKRVGLDGGWEVRTTMDESTMNGMEALREKIIQRSCEDMKTSMVICAGLAVVYGIGACALSIAGGVDAVPDMCGEAIESTVNNSTTLSTSPHIIPVCIVLDQIMIDRPVVNSCGERKTRQLLQRDLLGLTVSMEEKNITMLCWDIRTEVESVKSVPSLVYCKNIPISCGRTKDFKWDKFIPFFNNVKGPNKCSLGKVDVNNNQCMEDCISTNDLLDVPPTPLMEVLEYFSYRLTATISKVYI